MKTMKLQACLADPCIYKKDEIWLLLYVDDVFVISKHLQNVQHTIDTIVSHLDVKNWDR